MPKLLWVSPVSLHDSSSRSAMQMRTLLIMLKRRGVDIVALCALNFNSPSGTSMFTDLNAQTDNDHVSFNLTDNDIKFIYIKTASRRLGDMPSSEQRSLFAHMGGIINEFKPDVVMGSGFDMLSMACFDEAHRRQIPTVYVLYERTPGYFNFPGADVIMSDSQAMKALYASTHGINVHCIGSVAMQSGPLFLKQPLNVAPHTERKRITLIGADADSGIGIFARLMQCAKGEAEKRVFTVIEGQQGEFAEQLLRIRENGKDKSAFTRQDLERIEVLPAQTDLAELMKETAVLVAPYLRFTAAPFEIREAVSYGTPILGTNLTGIAEVAMEAGVLVEPPAHCYEDHFTAPDASEMQNFASALETLLTQDHTDKCARVAAGYDTNACIDRAVALLQPLFAKRAGNNPQLFRLGNIV